VKLQQTLDQAEKIFETTGIAGVFIGYCKGGSGGTGLALKTPFSLIHIHPDTGDFMLGPFSKDDKGDSVIPIDKMEETIRMIASIKEMLAEQLEQFTGMEEYVSRFLSTVGIRVTKGDTADVYGVPGPDEDPRNYV
jgi:hypothetical protein